MSWKSVPKTDILTTTTALTPAPANLDSHFENDVADTLSINSSSLSAQRPNFEGITLIWYDPRINKTEDTLLTAVALREINDYLILHSDPNECIEYMKMVQNEKIFLITSGKAVIPILHEKQQLKQLDSIFIFCMKDEKYQHLLKEYEIIVGIYRERSELIQAIKQNVNLFQKQTDVFNFYKQHEEKSTRDISKESAEFLWFQLFKDVLLRMPRSDKAQQELINFSREYYRGNQNEYENIAEFEKSYNFDKSIYWYTKDSFLYRLVNKALRTEDIGQLHLFRFFISDLSSKISEIHKKRNLKKETIFLLYRGLKMDIDELNRLKENIGSVISANGFLSTSHSKKVAIRFAKKTTRRASVVSVLYEIECNLNTTKSIVFADIGEHSEFAEEQEVLFDIGSTFKIESVEEDDKLNMSKVKLTGTDAGMKLAQAYINLNRMRNEETTPDILFGILLVQMGKYDQSLSYFKSLLDTSNKEIDKARVYNGMGSAHLCKFEFDEAYKFANYAYKLMIRTKPCRIKDSTKPMTLMGHVHFQKEEYEESLDFCFEALEIRNKFYGRKHLDTAVALNHVGNVYYKMEKYKSALSYYEKSFDINVEKLPHVHLDIAANLNNIGLILWKDEPNRYSSLQKNENLTTMLTHVDALSCFRESLNIRKQVLPANHNDIIQSLENIIKLLCEQDDSDMALEYFAEKLALQKLDFDPNDHDDLLVRLQENFRLQLTPRWKECAWAVEGSCGPPIDSHSASPNLTYGRPMRPSTSSCDFSLRPYTGVTENPAPQLYCAEPLDLEYKRGHRILKNFIKTLKSGNDYNKDLQAVNEVFMVKNTSLCDETSIGLLMNDFQNLVEGAYDRNDISNEAIRFYIKVWLILDIWSCVDCIYNQQAYGNIYKICVERAKFRQNKVLSALQDIIENFKNNGDYCTIIDTAKEILKTFSENLSQIYNHTEYLMTHFRDFIRDAYDKSDVSNEAIRFYIKVLSILDKLSFRNCSKTGIAYSDTYKICTEKLELRKQKDVFVLRNFIETIKNNGAYYDTTLTAKEILTAFPQDISHTYDHTGYLIMQFHNLVHYAYNHNDTSNEAIRFYIKVWSILHDWTHGGCQYNGDQYHNVYEICMERVRMRQKQDLSVLQDFVKAIKNEDHHIIIERVKEILKAFPQNLSQAYDHIGYLIMQFHDLVHDAYNHSDTSNEAIRFYIKVWSILDVWSRGNCKSNEHRYHQIYKICIERIRLRQEKDLSTLKELIEAIKKNDDYHLTIKTVKKILTAFPESLSQTYNHNKYLMEHFHDLVSDAYASNEKNDEAARFYEKIKVISEKKLSRWVDISGIQLIYYEKIGYIHLLNSNYQLAAECLQNSVKIQRDKSKNISSMCEKLYDIGLLGMILRDYSLALSSFKEALELLKPYSDNDARRKRWILKRIGEVEKLSNP